MRTWKITPKDGEQPTLLELEDDQTPEDDGYDSGMYDIVELPYQALTAHSRLDEEGNVTDNPPSEAEDLEEFAKRNPKLTRFIRDCVNKENKNGDKSES